MDLATLPRLRQARRTHDLPPRADRDTTQSAVRVAGPAPKPATFVRLPIGYSDLGDTMTKSRTQQRISKLSSPTMAESMEAESRQWMVCCRSCGFERSIWELGGVRWKAKGTSWTWGRCPTCRKLGLHKIYHREPTETPAQQ